MRRTVLLSLCLAAGCSPMMEDDVQVANDAVFTCGAGSFSIAAPVAGLHYAPAMRVVVEETELAGRLDLTMTDDLGNAYASTANGSDPDPSHPGTGWSQDWFDYQLAPGRQYFLTVSHCSNAQSVAFFTTTP